MQIVVDIDKAVYEKIKETLDTQITKRHLGKTMMLEYCMEIVGKGTPLPKGHGRLIDSDDLLRTLNKENVEYDSDVNYFICHAPIIIEADEE